MNTKTNNDYTCNKCGTVYFGVTREHAEKEVEEFNEMYENLSAGEQTRYYGGTKACITKYEKCDVCGNPYENFRIAKEEDCPIGCTLSPIIVD